MSSPELYAYFKRIGYDSDAKPTLETLRAIHRLHPEHIPFENLDPLCGLPAKLDMPSLQKKLIDTQRGGYCYEHNLLLKKMLETLGYRVKGLAARVRWNVPNNVTMPMTHMLLRIEIDGTDWIADVGFGGQVLTGPLRLEPDVTQSTPHEDFRLNQTGTHYTLETQIREHWVPVYSFDLHEPLMPDYELSNWYVSTHPASRFVTGLTVARTEPNCRYTLRNADFAIHPLRGATQRHRLSSLGELKNALGDCFHISLPPHANLDSQLARVLETPSA
ncbi:MAG: arylamine N-acetyltransferase [Betaproteobacteria bacterium]|nr:arylamine N-acetyltransferase [Betaproteobacteria bacterium]